LSLSERVRHNIKRAIHLALEGSELGFLLIDMYCVFGNRVSKSVVCTPIIIHPELAPFSPCCVKNLNLAIENAREIKIPEPIIQRAVAIILNRK